MFGDDYGEHSGAWYDSGYAEARSTSGVDGGGNAQKTSSQVNLQNFLIESRICTDLLQGGKYDGHSS
jgi:hypothetical protein